MSLCGESFVRAVKTATSEAEVLAAVQNAVQLPSVLFFGDVLDAVRSYCTHHSAAEPSEELKDWAGVVELLTYGTVDKLDTAPEGVKKLISAHPVILHKLRVLSFLTFCSEQTMSVDGLLLDYAAVERVTGVAGPEAVHGVVLEAMQQKACVARLNEQTAKVRVLYYESRNVAANEMAELKRRLVQWTTYAEHHLRDLQ